MAVGSWAIPVSMLVAAILCAALIKSLFPLLQRYALARPNARSSHRIPTPQGGGIAVIGATLIAAALGMLLDNLPLVTFANVLLAVPVVLIAALGVIDDLNPVPVLPRLILQVLMVGTVVFTLPDRLELLSFMPVWAEKALLTIAGLWFVNLTNFMDGLDWMVVVEFAPMSLVLASIGAAGYLPQTPTLLAAALCGALIGFAPFNHHVARLFLGDVGSLAIGLLSGYMLLKLAASGFVAAALLLPLYFIADATITLLRRLAAREPVWEAHRSHFYQRATDHGFTVPQVTADVLRLNIALAALALGSIAIGHRLVDLILLAIGAALTAFVMRRFSTPKTA